MDFHGKENIAREIAWLKASRHILLEARRAKKGGVAPVMDDVVKPKLNINHNLGRVIKENDRVYLMRILVVDFFPPLAKAAFQNYMYKLKIFCRRRQDRMYRIGHDMGPGGLGHNLTFSPKVRAPKVLQLCINELVVWFVQVCVNNLPTCHSF